MKQPKIVLFTHAYNAETTLRRTVDSVLAQTFEDFSYYLLDNGSTDRTWEIVQAYAAKDSRIIPLRNEVNWVGYNLFFPIDDPTVSDDCYFCTLDADDAYDPDFFAEMLEFSEANRLDVAGCGSRTLDKDTGALLNIKAISQTTVLHGSGFEKQFIDYYHQMRTIWGKLYRMSVLRKCAFSEVRGGMPYGGDSAFATEACANAERVGFLSTVLHAYYYNSQGTMGQYLLGRAWCNRIELQKKLEFMEKRCGGVSQRNGEFLQAVYLHTVNASLQALQKAALPAEQKWGEIHVLFSDPYMWELAASRPRENFREGDDPPFTEVREIVFSTLCQWMALQEETRITEVGLAAFSETLACTGEVPPALAAWGADIRFFVWRYVRDRRLANGRVPAEAERQLRALLDSQPLTRPLALLDAIYMQGAVMALLRENLPDAADALFVMAEGGEIEDAHSAGYLQLGINVCAAMEYAEGWLLFRKLWTQYLMEQSRTEEARQELGELEELLPGDAELQALRQQLPKK